MNMALVIYSHHTLSDVLNSIKNIYDQMLQSKLYQLTAMQFVIL